MFVLYTPKLHAISALGQLPVPDYSDDDEDDDKKEEEGEEDPEQIRERKMKQSIKKRLDNLLSPDDWEKIVTAAGT